jgi:hypothetical protein
MRPPSAADEGETLVGNGVKRPAATPTERVWGITPRATLAPTAISALE